MLLDPLPSLTLSQQVIAAKCLVQVTKRKAYLKVLNPTYSDVHLKNQVLAKVEEIDFNNVIPFDDEQTSEVFSLESSTAESKLDFNLSESDLSEQHRLELKRFLLNNRDIFSADLSNLGKTNLYKHKIDTLPGAKPVRKQFYRTSPHAAKEIRTQIDEMLKHDIIQPSNSEWHSPVVLVKKKNGQLRFACDYRALNKKHCPNVSSTSTH